MTALTVLPGNDTLLERASRSICNDLSDFLSPWLLEAGPFAKVEESFRREILDPAIRLHQDLRSSCYRYDTKLITDIGRLSPKQMLEEWELKDADTWLKPRGENAVGKALYCLHPPILRLRDQGPPIVLVKAVMVVASPERERISNPQGIKGKVQRGTTAPPATTGSSTATSQTMSPRSTQHSSNQKKTSTRQSSGGSKRDQDVRPSNRGHRMEGTSKGSVPKVAPHQPSKRDSRDTSKDESSSRNSASKFSQPPLDPSSPGPSKPSAKHRSSKT